jgi:peptidylprolyl isomerase
LLSVGVIGATTSIASASFTAIPTVSGAFDRSPTITFPNSAPPSTLVVKVLHNGNGQTVKKKDCIVVNYVGRIWRGKVFDTSYTRQLAGIPIGVGQVIKGWDTGLVGQKVGSRVLLVVPPKYGYGSKGQSTAGIKGTDTIIFVVDIVSDYTSKVAADPKAALIASSKGGVSISGAMAVTPKVAVVSGTAQPKTASITMFNKGHGVNVKPGLVILQTLVTNWSGVTQASTWKNGTPDAELVGQKNSPSLLDNLVGKPLGSRFVAVIPKSGTSGPYVVVVDVVAQPHGESSQPS